MSDWRIINTDVIDGLQSLDEQSIQCVVTSPPYWGLRDYGVDNQLGLEKTPEEYVDKMVSVFREVRRVLRDDGTVWLNLGDSYAGGGRNSGNAVENTSAKQQTQIHSMHSGPSVVPQGLKPKDLCGIPWRVAFALQSDGWYLRSDIIWSKPNPMPESVTDRPTKAHEYLFLLTKSARYFYDADAIREENQGDSGWEKQRQVGTAKTRKEEKTTGYNNRGRADKTRQETMESNPAGRNKRSVWEITTQPFPEAHFAVMPTKLVEPCVLAGTSKEGQCVECGAVWERVVEKAEPIGRRDNGNGDRFVDKGMWSGRAGERDLKTIGWQPTCICNTNTEPHTVLDPFCGSGTVGVVALRHGRRFIGIDLSEEYCEMAKQRIDGDCPLFNREAQDE